LSQAFTLVELLVVIAIVAVLAAIAFPVVKSALNSAKAAETVSNLKQVAVLAANYAADNNNRLPNSIDWDAYGGKPPGLVFFARSLAENAGFAYAQPPRTATRPLPEIFYDPCLEGNTRQQHPMGAFGVNGSILPSGSKGVPLAKIDRPAQAVIFCSVSSKGSTYSSEWGFSGNDFATKGLGADPCPDVRNAGRVAALFADGHVEKLDVKNMDQATRQRLFARDP
jgi:prepilin-type N-terminal cleavage/methylation domain-containing protein/prepilin-type processing-associated H-X9-DG protein